MNPIHQTEEEARLGRIMVEHEETITRLTAENEKLGRDYQSARDAHDKVLAENEKLRAALLVARKYVLVQSCELSLQPDDAARDLDVIDEALEEDDD